MTAPISPSDQLSVQNPWPGLRAFTESDRNFFFGREAETAELVRLIDRSPVVVLYGQSGLGKTSLLQAGLLPALRELNYLPLRLVLQQDDGAPSMAQQLKAALAAEITRASVSATPPGPNETLWEYSHRRDLDFWGPGNRLLTPLVVLDQFEEVFTLGQSSERAAARVAEFARDLESVLEHRPPDAVRDRLEANPSEALGFDPQRQSIRFLVSLREDFLPHLDTWRTRIPSLLPTRFRLEPMSGARACQVVQHSGRELVTAEVSHEIVDFVSTSQRSVSPRALEQREVQPALLSVVCDELNRRRIGRGQAQISTELLTDERQKIIEDFYDRAFEGIDPRVRVWVEDRLLTESGYRNRAPLEDAVDHDSRRPLPPADFELLVDRRVLHREERGGVVWLELTHDLLTDPAARSRAARLQRSELEEKEAELRRRVARLRARRMTAVVVALILFAFGAAGWYSWAVASRATAQAKELNVMAVEQRDRADAAVRVLTRDSTNLAATLTALEARNRQHLHDDSVTKMREQQNVLTAEAADAFKRNAIDLRKRSLAQNSALHEAALAMTDTVRRASVAAVALADSLRRANGAARAMADSLRRATVAIDAMARALCASPANTQQAEPNLWIVQLRAALESARGGAPLCPRPSTGN